MEKRIDNHKLNNEELNKKSCSNSSLYEILETVNKYISNDDFQSASLFINLSKLIKNSELTSKVTILTLDSIIKFKTKNVSGLLKNARRILKYLKNNPINFYPVQILALFIKILFKTAQACEVQENSLIPCLFYYLCKTIYENQDIQTDDSTFTIVKSKIPVFLNRIAVKVIKISKINL